MSCLPNLTTLCHTDSLERLQGFSIGLYSTADLPNARQLAISSPIPGYPEGSSIVYVGSSGTPGSVRCCSERYAGFLTDL